MYATNSNSNSNNSNSGIHGARGSSGMYRDSNESFFDDSFHSMNTSAEFWSRCDDYDRLDHSELIFQGRLHQKNPKTKKWQPFHFELYSDRLIRTTPSSSSTLTSTSTAASLSQIQQQSLQQPSQSIAQTQQLPSLSSPSFASIVEQQQVLNAEQATLSSCYLKKIKYSDASYANYKYGIRLQKGELKSELFTDSAENFNKLYEEIKRFCLLPKFSKKFKVLSKIKSPPHMLTAHFYACFRFSDSQQYSVRIIDKYALTESGRIAMAKEVAILRKFDHPALLKLHEIYEDEANIFIVYELLHGPTLHTYLTSPVTNNSSSDLLCLDERFVSDLLWKLLHGLQHMHARNVMHRDIRLDNIYFRAENNFTDICFSNFHLADFIDIHQIQTQMHQQQQQQLLQQQYSSQQFTPTKTNARKYNTPGYIAPEMLKQYPLSTATSKGGYDAKVDIFALGVIFYFLVCGHMPFEGKDTEETMRLNEKCEIDFNLIQPLYGKFTSSALDLMRKMLDRDPKNRPDAASLINHTWFINMRNRTSNSDGPTSSSNSSNNNNNNSINKSNSKQNNNGSSISNKFQLLNNSSSSSSSSSSNNNNNISNEQENGGEYFQTLTTVQENQQETFEVDSENERELDSRILKHSVELQDMVFDTNPYEDVNDYVLYNHSDNHYNNRTSSPASTPRNSKNHKKHPNHPVSGVYFVEKGGGGGGEFSGIKADDDDDDDNDQEDDNHKRKKYVYNVTQDGSLVYEDEFVKETLQDKMRTLNRIKFIKVPSKGRHDSFHLHLSTHLGINIQEFYNLPAPPSPQPQLLPSPTPNQSPCPGPCPTPSPPPMVLPSGNCSQTSLAMLSALQPGNQDEDFIQHSMQSRSQLVTQSTPGMMVTSVPIQDHLDISIGMH